MASKQVMGTMELTRTDRLYDHWKIRLRVPPKQRPAFEKNPAPMTTEFLEKRGFKVNALRFATKRSAKAKRMRDIDIVGARHAHSGRSKSGWV